VRELRREARFALEPRAVLAAVAAADELEGDPAAEIAVPRAIDLPHAAAAKEGVEGVSADAGPGFHGGIVANAFAIPRRPATLDRARPLPRRCPAAVPEIQGLADRAVAQAPPDRFFARPDPGSNSIALIVKHLAGNLRSRWTRFLETDGEKPDRDRDAEFEEEAGDTRETLLARWEEGWRLLFEALAPLGAADLARTVTIRGESHTVLEAIARQLTHYAYHVGQIVFLAKQFAGPSWTSLSIPRGKSKEVEVAKDGTPYPPRRGS
jgi:hypothetical protein